MSFAGQEVSSGTAVDSGVRPFLKWAGGKSKLLDEILSLMPASGGRYFEPFLGGGAVFFAFAPSEPAMLSDSNVELSNCYKVVRDNVEDLVNALHLHKNTKDHYYKVRQIDPATLPPVKRAARTIFLNRTCFNGLYRVNKKGEFNVPFGDYTNPNIVRPDVLREASAALSEHELAVAPYLEALEAVGHGDVVYLDPPYIPLGGYSDFKRYNESPFGLEDHQALAQECKRLDNVGAWVVLSNSSAAAARELYTDFNIREVAAPRSVSANPKGRRPVTEILVTNF